MKKIKEVLNVFFKTENKDNSHSQDEIEIIINSVINGPFSRIKKSLLDIISIIKETITLLLQNLDNSLNKKDKLFLLIITKSFIHLSENFEKFKNFVLKEFCINENLNEQINNFLTEISKNIKTEMNKTIGQFLENALNIAVNQINIDVFISMSNDLLGICSFYFTKFELNSSTFFCKFENGKNLQF